MKKQRFRGHVLAALVGTLAVLASAIVPTTAAVAAGPATVQMEFSALGNITQGSGAPFNSMVSLSCAGATGASCDDVEITIPWPAEPDPALGAAAISTWAVTAASNVTGLVDANVIRDDVNRQWVIKLKQPIYADGSSTSIQFTFTPPNGSTLNGFQIPVQPTVSGSSFPAVTAPDPVVFTATAKASPSLSKSLLGSLVPGSNATWRITYGLGASGTVGTLGFVNGSRKIVDVLPPEVEFVDVTTSVPYEYDAATHTLTFSTDNLPYPLPGATQYTINVVTKVKSDVVPGTVIKNDASMSYQLVGDTQVTRLDRSASGVVVADVSYGALFSKSGSGNLEGGAPGYAQPIVDQVATEAETDRNVRYSISASRTDNPYRWEMEDPFPCLDGTGTTLVSGDPGTLCTQPAFNLVMITPSSHAVVTKTGTLTGDTVTLVYTDGTSEDIPVKLGIEIFPKAGGKVATVKVNGEYTTTGTGSSYFWLDGTIDASLQNRTEVLTLQNRVHGRGATIGSEFKDNYSFVPKTMSILRNYVSGGVTSTPTYTFPTAGASVYMAPYSSLQTTSSTIGATAKSVVVFPREGFTPKPSNSLISLDSDWMGTGQPALVYRNGIAQGFNISRNDIAPGAYPYEVYTGFGGTILDKCSATVAGTTLTTNDLFVDTTGIIGEPGVPTSVCHQTGYLIVTGPVPDSQTTKMVRGDLDTSWMGQPGTSLVNGDGTGTADFKITWTNVGSTALQNTTLYDVLPTPGDTYTVGNQNQRGSTFRPTLAGPVAAPAGWTVAYSTAANPCRPEVLATNPGCAATWVTTPPNPISGVTALRFTKTSQSAIGYLAEFTYTVNAGAFSSKDDIAWNTVSTRTYVPGTTPAPLAPTETPRVGIGMVAEPGIELVKEVCDAASCDPNAALGAGGWTDSTSAPYLGSVTWRLTVTNTGDAPLSNVEITDALVSDCDVNIGNLAVGAQASRVCESTDLTASMTNTAEVSGIGSAVPVTDSDTATVTVAPKPVSSLTVVKQVCDATSVTCDPNAAVDASEWSDNGEVSYEGNVMWRVIVTNTGVTTLTGIRVADIANASCGATIASLLPLASQTLSCSDSSLTAGLTNTVSVAATPPFGDPDLTDTSSATVTVSNPTAALSLTKEVCDADSCDPDAELGEDGWASTAALAYDATANWRITVTNTGQSDLDSVTISDPLAEACDVTNPFSLAKGASESVICASANVTAGFTNTATATGIDAWGSNPTDSDSASVTVGPKPDSSIELVYESCDPDPVSDEVACDPDAPAGTGGWSHSTTVPFEGSGKWRVTVKNTGDTTLTDVTVVNSAYPGCEFTTASLASGASASQTCDVTAVDGTLESTASVTATPPYGDPALTATDTAEIVSVDPVVEISVEKEVCSTGNTCDPNAASLTGGWVKATELEPGDAPFWRFVVTNTGQVDLSDVAVSDPSLPDCDATFATLGRGEVQIITCTGEPAFAGVAGTVTATGTDTRSGTTITVSSDSEAQVTVRDFASAVAVKKESCFVAVASDCRENGTGWTTHAVGDFGAELWWRITVINAGDTAVSDVVVTDEKFPAGDFTVDTLPAGESRSVVFSAGPWKVIDPNSAAAENSVVVAATAITGDPLEASASATGAVNPAPNSTDGADEGDGSAVAPQGGPVTGGLSTTGGQIAALAIGAGVLVLGGLVVVLLAIRRRRRAEEPVAEEPIAE